jgi:hypothetical protein
MNKEQITKVILDYYHEVRDHYNEMSTAFGYEDSGSQRSQIAYTTLLILIEKLELDETF